LNPTRKEALTDARGRPYFLWDVDVTLERLRDLLASNDPETRTYWLAKVMRQAKPDDVFSFASVDDIARAWPAVQPLLGHSREFWRWLISMWEKQDRVRH
jgi:LmbE family N-acetylglucosaminyl deacetylase